MGARMLARDEIWPQALMILAINGNRRFRLKAGNAKCFQRGSQPALASQVLFRFLPSTAFRRTSGGPLIIFIRSERS